MPSEQVYSLLFQSRDTTSSLYILFGGIVDPVASRIERFEVVAVGNSELINIPLSGATFKDITNVCQKIKYEGKQLKNLTNKLQELFQTSGRSDDFMEQLIHYINKREDEKIRYLINQVGNQAMGNTKPDISLWYSLVDRDKIEEAGSSRPSFETLDAEEAPAVVPDEAPVIPVGVPTGVDANIPANATRIQFKFILSPVSGIPVNQLRPGDQIVVQLIGSDPATLGIIDVMKLKMEDGSIKPVPATIVATENKGVENETVIKIGNDIFGKIYEEENSIKVRPYTGEKPAAAKGSTSSASAASSASLEAGESSLLLTVLIALGVVGIGMVAVFVFLF
ncbi:hypothetical protein EHO59_04420 [Leptospira semungkisensis]|uniref:DUF4899 domain-containing protein n=1 Tax=Leptospira semungkisensis TaxID=2484985 RepID=A0A4R9G903_9LEPT|nr:hypothetical protein [Leptospira semungkisensis]TGK07357.1 hypothetical protein EHO59_04420 [Leptospira semungkisensis]